MFWGVTMESGKRYSQIVESSYHLSMAALEPNCKATNKSVSVMIEHGKTEFLLCTLEYDHIMQVPLDLLFIEGEEVSFFLNGEGVVHLTGYVTDNEDKTAALSSDQSNEESENLSEESELSDQEDISCSKLMALDSESESTGEEWTPEKALSKKRKKLSTRSNIPKLQSLEEKKPQKPDKEPKSYSKTVTVEKSNKQKQKTNQTNKNDISVSTVSSDLESDEEIEDDEDEEEEVDLDEEDEEESEDEDEESEEDSDDDKNKSSDSLTTKKIGSRDASIVSPKQTLNPSEFKKGLNKMSSHNESRSSNANASKSIETLASKKKQETSFKRKADDNLQSETPSGNKICHTPPKTINEVPASSSGKKKRKRSLKKDENSSFRESSKKDTPSVKLQSGIKITDIKQGNGPQAKKGKFVHVCYVGRLNSGVKFDSVEDRPFSFRLGCGEVIKGLDTGIEGMKVGGKRKVVVPPVQGYGNKKIGPIPPNSTLQFEVELKAVS